MKLFNVIMMKRSKEQADRLLQALRRSADGLHNANLIHITLNDAEDMAVLQVEGVLPQFELLKDAEAVYAGAASAIADYMLAEEERKLIRKLIREEFEYDQEDEMAQIMVYCEQMLSGASSAEGEFPLSHARDRRKGKIISEVTGYLSEHTELNLDGFMRFRLHGYMDELREVVEYAVDEYVMDRQHQEFISLLQYFVYIQEAKIPFVHLIHKGGGDFLLLNDRMERINTDDREATVTVEMLEKDMNFEDMIVSTLITVSPQQIYIHTREPEVQVIKTISQIFENRVELCGYCRLCHSLDRSTAGEYNKG
ncbi:putative sporulation protein YtxC [Paenibacillus filicis]|uniref:Sporulation protein YtxC n=1 Tax=Paenibacillus gyeongsangnamensis TaxID=3388067 RepID=A0ABT4QI13_9BACL|nr:putative sporulation protein YtxC [Paenibacillus filicis]MCZ8516525.1 putative sporulation protein YtxC [Paenibacillus filicis]